MIAPARPAATSLLTGYDSILTAAEALLAARRLPEAIASFRQAEQAGEDADRCSAGKWMTYMLLGEFEAAWQESDAIRRRNPPDPTRFWQGESLAGQRVMLRCLHGFGDAVQFLRYAPRLRDIASQLIVEVPPRFLELARYFDGVDEVITWGEQAPKESPEWDVQIEVMELPYIFRTRLHDLPVARNYLHLPETKPLKTRSAKHLRVALSWTAGDWNPARAIPLELINPILASRDCEFVSLLGGPAGEEAAEASFRSLHQLTHQNMQQDDRCTQTILGLANTISELDLVITVDTLAAHLAGALGIPVWVMLKYEADWRWMYDREDNPWYPNLRIFRQPGPGDWTSVITDVCRELSDAVALPRRTNAKRYTVPASDKA